MRQAVRSDQSWRVLYVEDCVQDAELCCKQLKHAGYGLAADIVSSPEEFQKALREKSYDVVLADFNLPNWSGMGALETLQQEGLDIPFILVTGTVGEETAVECIKRGATDYVLKDRPARLPLAIERALEDKSVREERRRAERSRDLLASLVESSDDAILGTALDGTIATWNRGAERLYGYPAGEARGKPISLLFPAYNAGELRPVRDALQRGARLDHYEARGARKDGGVIEVSVTISPIRDGDGKLTGASMIARDITEHKRLQQEFFVAKKMEAMGRLAAGVAHDFNNLLTVIAGYSSMVLTEMSEDDPGFTGIREINKAGEKAASLTRQLLAFCRKHPHEPTVLDLNAIVADMDRMLRRLIGEDIDLVTSLDPALGPVRADPGQIEQVIVNLAVNARDAMIEGGKLTIETANVEIEPAYAARHISVSSGSCVMLAMTDTGLGLSPEIQARIFEPFFTTKGPERGTGLGLATVYGIVKQSSGAILVYSEPDHGTTFKIYLPRVQEAPQTGKPPAQPSPSRGSETVLVVEDDGAIRTLICEVLEKLGYAVHKAGSGAEALRFCEQYPGRIDLVISDVVMPSMGGRELAARLASSRPEIKILFMSGYTDNAILHHGDLAPRTAFLEKPFMTQTLARKVREALG